MRRAWIISPQAKVRLHTDARFRRVGETLTSTAIMTTYSETSLDLKLCTDFRADVPEEWSSMNLLQSFSTLSVASQHLEGGGVCVEEMAINTSLWV